jgi:hypothetical protein
MERMERERERKESFSLRRARVGSVKLERIEDRAEVMCRRLQACHIAPMQQFSLSVATDPFV